MQDMIWSSIQGTLLLYAAHYSPFTTCIAIPRDCIETINDKVSFVRKIKWQAILVATRCVVIFVRSSICCVIAYTQRGTNINVDSRFVGNNGSFEPYGSGFLPTIGWECNNWLNQCNLLHRPAYQQKKSTNWGTFTTSHSQNPERSSLKSWIKWEKIPHILPF